MVKKVISFKNVEFYMNKFKTLNDIVKYEEDEMKKVNIQNKATSERKEKNRKERNEVYRKYS